MKYINYNCLLHRDGGISHTTNVTKAKIDFVKDLLRLSELYVFLNFKKFSEKDKNYIVKRYIENREYVIANGYEYDDSNYSKLKKDNLIFFAKRKLNQISSEFGPRLKKQLKIEIILLFLTTIFLTLYRIFVTGLSTIFKNLTLFFLILSIVEFIRILMLIFIKIIYKIKDIK